MTQSLTVGVSWNGHGDLQHFLERVVPTSFVHEVLIAPSTPAVEAKALNDSRDFAKVRVLAGGDRGIYEAWNKIVDACTSTYLCFHGVDDFLVGTPAIDAAIDQASRLPSIPMLVFTAHIVGQSGATISHFHHREAATSFALGRLSSPLCPEVLYPTAAVKRAGGLDTSFRIAGDADLYFRVRRDFERLDITEILVRMTDGGASASAKHAWTVFRENRRIAHRYGQVLPVTKVALAGTFLGARHLLYKLGGERFAAVLTDMLRRLVGKSPRYSA